VDVGFDEAAVLTSKKSSDPGISQASQSSVFTMAASQSPLNVAIIGAGIGGLAVAIGLLKENIPYTIYEAAAEYSMVGAGVGLGPNALRSMNLIDSRFKDLYDSIATGNSTREKENIIYDVRTVEPGWGENEGWTGFPVGSKNYIRTSAHRKDLLDIMTSMIPIETVRFRKKVASMKQEGGKVVINFEDGEVVEASTVIGCDGVHGASRPAVLGERYPEHVYATYSGKYVYRSIVPMENAIELLGDLAGDGQMFMGNKRNILAYPISQGKDCNVVAFRYEPWPHEQWTHMVSREKMISDFDGCDPRLVKLLDVRNPPFLIRMIFLLTMSSGQSLSSGLFGTTSRHLYTTTA
jgi:salicylate hydroxylase